MRLKDKTALITGGTTGIGFATAKLFLSEGARVAITGVSVERLEEARVALGGAVVALRCDVRDSTALASAAERVQSELGGLDALFANAGVAYATPLAATPEARFDEIMAINVKGVFFTMVHFAPILRAGASVVLNTSWLGDVGTAGLSVLSASKAAVRSLARTWSAELAPRNIRVNAVSPGAIATPIHGKTGMSPDDLRQFASSLQAKIPLGRFGEPAEVAAAVAFLASDESRYMLGAEIAVDGGFAQL